MGDLFPYQVVFCGGLPDGFINPQLQIDRHTYMKQQMNEYESVHVRRSSKHTHTHMTNRDTDVHKQSPAQSYFLSHPFAFLFPTLARRMDHSSLQEEGVRLLRILRLARTARLLRLLKLQKAHAVSRGTAKSVCATDRAITRQRAKRRGFSSGLLQRYMSAVQKITCSTKGKQLCSGESKNPLLRCLLPT